MKYLTAILLALACSASAQVVKDRRALLNTKGRINSLSASPAGALWLVTSQGNT